MSVQIGETVMMNGNKSGTVRTVTGFLPAGTPCKSGKCFPTDRWILDDRWVAPEISFKPVIRMVETSYIVNKPGGL